MAKYPDTHSRYPVNPKAYPVTPKAYPATLNSFPSGTTASPPLLTGIATNVAGTRVIVTFNQALDAGSVPALVDFTFAGAALSVLTGTPAISGSTVELSVTPAINTLDTGMTLSYTAGGSPIQNAAGEDAANFATQAVTNSSTYVFSPTDIAGLVGWFDMLDPTSFTEVAGTITGVTNKASSTVWNTGTLPAYSATGLNSKPCMDFNGTTHLITSTEAAVWQAVQNAGAYTLFIVAAIDTVDRLEAMFAVGKSDVSSNNTRVWGQTNSATGLYRSTSQNDAGTAVTVLGTTQTDTSKHLLMWRSPGTTVDGEIDGAADVTAGAQNPGTLTPNRACIGARPDTVPDQFYDGKIGEILLYNSQISLAGVALIEARNARWS